MKRIYLDTTLLALLVLVCSASWTQADPVEEPPVRLELLAPRDVGKKGALLTTRWPVILRLEVADAPALIETAEGSGQNSRGRREALILRDPDDCIDMRDFPILDPGMPYEPCAGPDEEFLEFTSERFDSHDVDDENTGNFLLRDKLVDDPFIEGELLNKPYLRNRSGEVVPLSRPRTGEERLDGYGYGADDDLPGLVLMADLGGARVFSPDFDLVPGVIRNLAGFVNTVSVELLDKRNKTAIVASLHVLAGLFEPLALFDLSVDDPRVDFLRRLESSPVRAFRFAAPPANDDQLFEALLETYSPVEFTLRAVVVEGEAPLFIHDMDGNGRFTAVDLERMGFRVLSNPAAVKIREELDLLLTDTPQGRTCPPRSLMFGDLDGNGEDGAVSCSGTGGARRLTRVPR